MPGTELLTQWQPLLVAVICVLVILLFLQLMGYATISSKGLNAKAEGMYTGPTGNFGDANYLRLKSERDDAGGAIAYLPPSVNPKDQFAGSNGRNDQPSFWNPNDMSYAQAAGLTLDNGSTDGFSGAPWAVGRRTTGYSQLSGFKANPDDLNGQKLNPY